MTTQCVISKKCETKASFFFSKSINSALFTMSIFCLMSQSGTLVYKECTNKIFVQCQLPSIKFYFARLRMKMSRESQATSYLPEHHQEMGGNLVRSPIRNHTFILPLKVNNVIRYRRKIISKQTKSSKSI